jgi:hypothetical protein
MLNKITPIALLGVLSLGCSGDDEGWELEIVNQTTSAYDIYEKNSVDGDEYVKTGMVEARDEEDVAFLQEDVTYTFRLVPVDGDVDTDSEHEKSFNRSNTKDQVWTVK